MLLLLLGLLLESDSDEDEESTVFINLSVFLDLSLESGPELLLLLVKLRKFLTSLEVWSVYLETLLELFLFLALILFLITL